MPFTIRPATMTDLETVVRFNLQLAAESEHKLLDQDTVRQGVAALLADATKGRYFVACRHEDIVGQIMHTREWSDWRNGDIWWIQSVYVAQPFRRQGVFRRLYNHLYEEAERTPHVVGVRLYVEAENFPAHETYQSFGLIKPGYFVMERWISRG